MHAPLRSGPAVHLFNVVAFPYCWVLNSAPFFFFLKVNGHPGSEELDRGGTGGQRRGGAFRWCCRTVGAEAGSVWGRRISWAVCWLKQIHARGRSCTQLASSSHVRRRCLSSRDFRVAWDENPLDIIVHTRMARLIWD